MNGVHDMGGMHGFGSIPREENDRVFHAPWEGRMFGMLLAMGSHGVHDPDGLRSALERLEPSQYLTLSYFERWLQTTEKALQAKGLITIEELDRRMKDFSEAPGTSLSRREDPALNGRLMKAVRKRSPSNRESGISPRFQVGDSIAVRNIHPQGHTRLPRYVRGKRGSIARFHGIHDFHDVLPEGESARPQPVYSVRFEAHELWGESAEANGIVNIDMWESYINPN